MSTLKSLDFEIKFFLLIWLSTPKDIQKNIMNKIALAILAHPDDAEFLCAGTLLRLKNEQGYQIHIATMTAGDCGSAEHTPTEIAAIRRREGAAACEVIGATYHCVEAFDLRVFLNADLMERVVHLINKDLRLFSPIARTTIISIMR